MSSIKIESSMEINAASLFKFGFFFAFGWRSYQVFQDFINFLIEQFMKAL